ncbi:MAG: hypothetical protein J6J86_04995 [Lachnospiraceae bacterium]|nr:hypothetical protein [Lachnospiraceae bacterium]
MKGKRKCLGATDIMIYGVILLLMLVTIYPMWYVLMASFSDPVKVYQSGGILLKPVDIQWEGYKHVFANKEIWSGYFNTIVNTVLATACNVLLTASLAYSLSKRSCCSGSILPYL